MIALGRYFSRDEARLLTYAPNQRPLAPWEQDRFKLVTPLDMIRFYAGMVVVFTRDLTKEICLLDVSIADGGGDKSLASNEIHRDGIIKALSGLLEYPHEMPLSSTLRLTCPPKTSPF